MSPIIQSKFATYVRSFVFGVEDSLISTAGLLSGIAAANMPSGTIILTGVVLIVVEAFSMAMGSFLSESSAEDYLHERKAMGRTPIIAGIIMFVSYFISGFIPLFPYIVWPAQSAFWISIILTLSALFLLGVTSAKIANEKIVQRGIRMLLIGGAALVVGVVVGKLL